MESVEILNQPILLQPEYRDYVWGGNRLKPPESPIAEMWAVYEKDIIATGPLEGKTLGEIAKQFGARLLGARSVSQTGARFPLLIKLLDCARWLSLQVHPNNEQAQRLEGPDQFGKTEAWYIVEADEGAELLAGIRPGLTSQKLEEVIRGGKILEWMDRHTVHAGDAIFISPGTVHALGPGLLVYEVQQTSDITYRVFDWNRPASDGRALHVDKSLAVIDLHTSGNVVHLPQPHSKEDPLLSCNYFTLEHLELNDDGLELDTQQETFHALTVIAGELTLEGSGWSQKLARFQSVVVPAEIGKYSIQAEQVCQILKSSV